MQRQADRWWILPRVPRRTYRALFFDYRFAFMMGGLALLICLWSAGVRATGHIGGTERFAWSSQTGWLNFHPAHGGVTAVLNGADSYLKGFAWSENIGWVKLGAGEGNGPYANTSADNWGVNMDAGGNLSGYAWSSHAGWINFNPTHSQATVALDTGMLDGFAWGENIGWIRFRHDALEYGAQVGPGPDAASAIGHWELYE